MSIATPFGPSSQPLRILIDTNVWLDNYLSFRPNSKASRLFIEAALRRGAELIYPVHCLKDVFFLIQRSLKRESCASGSPTEEDYQSIQRITWSCIDNMRSLATAVGADEADAWTCAKRKYALPDLEDSMVVSAAERAQASLIVTNDAQLIHQSPLAACTPKQALLFLQA
ncbi:MAG: PIN domain-containing protein [Coriobacteriia bacterium]|nr:PIN domain-containing protein [Coriobacteriia bacterium]